VSKQSDSFRMFSIRTVRDGSPPTVTLSAADWSCHGHFLHQALSPGQYVVATGKSKSTGYKHV
jgi:hypothetical protein